MARRSDGCSRRRYDDALGGVGRCGAPCTAYGLCAEHNAEWEARRTITCLGCGERFFRRNPGQHSTGYCSEACRRAVLAQRQRTRRATERVPPPPRPCDHCGVAFEPARSDARFCSSRCRVAAHRRNGYS